MVFRGELLNDRSLCKSYVILIGRENLVGILLSGFLDHRKERGFHFLTIDDEGATEDLVTAVL